MNDRKASIHILRGTGDSIENKVPEAGQPMYDKSNNILYIGDGTKSPAHGLEAVTVADGAITSDKIGELEVATINIADDAVNGDKINTKSIDTDHLVDEAVTNDKIANDTISLSKLDLRDQDYSKHFVMMYGNQRIAGEKTFKERASFSGGLTSESTIASRSRFELSDAAKQSVAYLYPSSQSMWDGKQVDVYLPDLPNAQTQQLTLVSREGLVTQNSQNAQGVNWYLDASSQAANIQDKFKSIDERLDNLGFNEGTFIWNGQLFNGSTPIGATIKKQGKYAILDLPSFKWDYSAYTDPDAEIRICQLLGGASTMFKFKPTYEGQNVRVLGTVGATYRSTDTANPCYVCIIYLHNPDSTSITPYLTFQYYGSYQSYNVKMLMSAHFGWELE